MVQSLGRKEGLEQASQGGYIGSWYSTLVEIREIGELQWPLRSPALLQCDPCAPPPKTHTLLHTDFADGSYPPPLLVPPPPIVPPPCTNSQTAGYLSEISALGEFALAAAVTVTCIAAMGPLCNPPLPKPRQLSS